MMKLSVLGFILGLALPLSAWGQIGGEVKVPPQPGVNYIGSQQVETQCPASSAKPGPFPCTYPVSSYPPSPSVPAMSEAKKVYQSEVDQTIQRIQPGKDIKKKAIEQKNQKDQD